METIMRRLAALALLLACCACGLFDDSTAPPITPEQRQAAQESRFYREERQRNFQRYYERNFGDKGTR